MFSFPQPPVPSSSTADPAGDPCPVVHVSDSPEDLRHILRFHMPRDDSSPFVSSEPTYHMISAAVRLGQKYQMLMLFEHAVEYLKIYYTDDLDVWTASEPPGFDDVHSIRVVNRLTRLTGESSLLQAAVLLCCELDADIVKGFKREDGSREQLTLDDIGLCFVAKGRLIEESFRSALHVFYPNLAKKCTTLAECAQGFRKIQRELRDRTCDFTTTNPFSPYHTMFKDVHLCKHCRAMVKDRDVHERRAGCERLSEILGW